MCGDDSISFLSKKHFEEFSLPYLQRIYREFAYAETKLFHCDGNTTHLLDCIADIGMDIFNFDANMDIVLVKQKVGDRVCLLGNLSALHTLREGTTQEVDDACRHIVETAKPGGGLILSTGSGTGMGTPAENIEAMIAAGARYGRY
jgi:uroporphyrinogen decarboxylase